MATCGKIVSQLSSDLYFVEWYTPYFYSGTAFFVKFSFSLTE